MLKNKIAKIVACLLLVLILGGQAAHAASVVHRNVADLIRLSDQIIVADIIRVTDGLDGSVPYTEVTTSVTDALKNASMGPYEFRQFGLVSPRTMPTGQVNLNVTPAGWPRYKVGEKVILFLFKPAAITGLRTTVGLYQGKFNIVDGAVTNSINNQDLFRDVALPAFSSSSKTGPTYIPGSEAAKLVQLKRGPVDAQLFISFVRQAVDQGW